MHKDNFVSLRPFDLLLAVEPQLQNYRVTELQSYRVTVLLRREPLIFELKGISFGGILFFLYGDSDTFC